jgi:hypothetical protein
MMYLKKIVVACIACASITAMAQNSITTYFAQTAVLEQVVAEFDLATIRSSFGPKRDSLHRTLKSFAMTSKMLDAKTLVLENGDFVYHLQLLGRGDLNHDGIEDLEICFTEKAKHGSYHAQKPILLTKYSSSALAVALQFETDGCKRFAK